MKKYLHLIILLLILPFGVNASCIPDEYYISIEDDNMSVVECGKEVSDYSDIAEYNNRVLTIKEDVKISEITVNDIDLTITSNNKTTYIHEIYHRSYSNNSGNYHTLKMVNLTSYSLDMQSGYNAYVNGNKAIIEIEDSELHRFSLKNDVYENGINIKNSKIIGEGCSIDSVGPVNIENVEYEGSWIQSDNSSIYINKSDLTLSNNLYNDGGDGNVEIYDSNITFNSRYSPKIMISNYSKDTHLKSAMIIKNTSIKGGGIRASTDLDLPVYLENVKMDGTTLDIGPRAYIKNSDIKLNENTMVNLHSMEIENSNLEVAGSINNYSTKDTIINNTTIKVGRIFYEYGKTIINSSNIETACMTSADDLIVDNSYLKIIYNYRDSHDSAITLRGNFKANHSYLYIDNSFNNQIAFVSTGENNEIVLDDGLIVTDKNGVELKLVYKDGVGYSYYYDNDGNNISNSITLRAKANVTFKIVNGAWADGSINDIVITKDVWDKLQEGEIPSIEGLPNGHWEIVPSTNDYIKGDVTYVYVIDEVKGAEENPKTGINYIYTIISFIIAISLSIMYFKYFNRSYFMKG